MGFLTRTCDTHSPGAERRRSRPPRRFPDGALRAARPVMSIAESVWSPAAGEGIGTDIFALAARIYPICRSITGNGVRDTLRELGSQIALDIHEIPTGTAVFDWTIPKEWNIRDAYIKNAKGEKVVDFARSNLHVMSYSVPVRQSLRLSELK